MYISIHLEFQVQIANDIQLTELAATTSKQGEKDLQRTELAATTNKSDEKDLQRTELEASKPDEKSAFQDVTPLKRCLAHSLQASHTTKGP